MGEFLGTDKPMEGVVKYQPKSAEKKSKTNEKRTWLDSTKNFINEKIKKITESTKAKKEEVEASSASAREKLKNSIEKKEIILNQTTYESGKAESNQKLSEVKVNKFEAQGSVDNVPFAYKWHSIEWYQPYIQAAQKVLAKVNEGDIDTSAFPEALEGAKILKDLEGEKNISVLKKKIYKLTQNKEGLNKFYGPKGTLNMLLAYQRAENSANNALYNKNGEQGEIKDGVKVKLILNDKSSRVIINKKEESSTSTDTVTNNNKTEQKAKNKQENPKEDNEFSGMSNEEKQKILKTKNLKSEEIITLIKEITEQDSDSYKENIKKAYITKLIAEINDDIEYYKDLTNEEDKKTGLKLLTEKLTAEIKYPIEDIIKQIKNKNTLSIKLTETINKIKEYANSINWNKDDRGRKEGEVKKLNKIIQKIQNKNT